MAVICPKCSHVRPIQASNPDWQCPNCGICYARFTGHPPAPRLEASAVQGQGARLGRLLKLLLLLVLVLILKHLIERRQAALPQEQIQHIPVLMVQEEQGAAPRKDPDLAFADAMIAASGADAGLLHSLSGRLERACARNRYGLSEDACIARLRAREATCARQSADRFPGQIGDTGRMQALVRAYSACIFEQG